MQLTDAEERLLALIETDAQAAANKAAEGNVYTAMEHLHVAHSLARVALAFDPGELTEDAVRVAEQAAWAQAALYNGTTDRVSMDLSGVENAAEDL